MKSATAVIAALALLGGCYTYQAAGPADAVLPAPGTRVQVQLTSRGIVDLAQQLGPQVSYVEGKVLEADSTRLRLAVTQVEDARRAPTEWKGEQVTIPRDAIATIEQRRLSVGATALAGGLTVGGVVAAYLIFNGTGSATGSTGGRGGGAQ